MNNELAEIRPYEAPFYKERAWDLSDFQDWEKELLAAVKVGGRNSIEDELTKLETDEATRDWASTQPNLNAFAIPERRYHFHLDIIEASEQRLRQWRQLRAVSFKQFDPKVTQEMIAKLEKLEEEALEDLRYAHLEAGVELAEPYEAIRAKLGLNKRRRRK